MKNTLAVTAAAAIGLLACLGSSAGEAPPLDAGDDSEFESLFDGESLDGWFGATDAYEAGGGVLACKQGGRGELYTKRTFDNFVLRFDFRLTPGANNGIGLRAPGEGDPAYTGMESQVLDNTAAKYASLEPYQYHGSIYGVAPAKRGRLKPVGEWNEELICCRGRKVYIWLNGQLIVGVDLDEAAPGGVTIDGKDHPGLGRRSGHIGLLGHGDRVEFRNIRIREVE